MVLTENFSQSHPFLAWPANETIGAGTKTELTLICIVQNCKNGPFFQVGEHFIQEPNSSCTHLALLPMLDSTSSLDNNSFIYVKKTLSLKEVLKIMNNSNLELSIDNTTKQLISVCCKTHRYSSSISYIHVVTDQKSTDGTTNSSTELEPQISCDNMTSSENSVQSGAINKSIFFCLSFTIILFLILPKFS